MDDQLQPQRDPFDEQKSSYAKGAIFLWTVSGIFLFATTKEAHFVSWQGAAYFVGGLFASSIVFGAGFFGLARILSRILMRVAGSPQQPTGAGVAQLLGYLLLVAEAIVIFLAARWVLGLLL